MLFMLFILSVEYHPLHCQTPFLILLLFVKILITVFSKSLDVTKDTSALIQMENSLSEKISCLMKIIFLLSPIQNPPHYIPASHSPTIPLGILLSVVEDSSPFSMLFLNHLLIFFQCLGNERKESEKLSCIK